MSNAVLILGFLNLLIAGALLAWSLRLRRQARALQQTADALAPAAQGLPEAFQREADQQGAIVVRVLNPMELAATRSRFAAAFGSMAGKLIRRKVLEHVAESLRQGLAEQQVQADVRIYRD